MPWRRCRCDPCAAELAGLVSGDYAVTFSDPSGGWAPPLWDCPLSELGSRNSLTNYGELLEAFNELE